MRDATARFIDVEKAEAAGYHDIGLFVPNMGWHYMKDALVDGKFDPTKPELLVYADDPCGGKRKLVAVEYAVPLSESKRAPLGFVGRADEWDANQQFQLWTLHAWLFEFNEDGVSRRSIRECPKRQRLPPHIRNAALWAAFADVASVLTKPGRRSSRWACGSIRSRRRAAR